MDLLQFIDSQHYDTDKIALGYIEGFYDRVFSQRRHQVENLLEIGIYKGHSILMWRDYFEHAMIQGVDINYNPILSGQPRVIQTLANAYAHGFINQLRDQHYDIIIDDGPHTFESMVVFLSRYLCKLKPGGIMVLEDIVDASWADLLTPIVTNVPNYSVEVVHMANRQRDPVLNHQWRNGLDIIIIEKSQ